MLADVVGPFLSCLVVLFWLQNALLREPFLGLLAAGLQCPAGWFPVLANEAGRPCVGLVYR